MRAGLIMLALWLALMPSMASAHLAVPPDPRFGIVETFVNPQAAGDAGAGFTRVILRWDVIQPGSPADWKPANVPDPLIAAETGRRTRGRWAADRHTGLGQRQRQPLRTRRA